MPELPEVETIRRQLAPLVQGSTLTRIEISDPRWSRPLAPAEVERALTGRRIKALGRRGKYLVWEFSGDVYLAQHLRMTGAILNEPSPEPAHVRVRMWLTRPKRRLVIDDPRRFGTGELLLGAGAMEEFFAARLGYEPMDERFTAEHLRSLARGRTTPIKALLLDQRRIAGVGNIYADEALFEARIHPLSQPGRVSPTQAHQLYTAIRKVLSRAVRLGGTSFSDYLDVEGRPGAFLSKLKVYQHTGEPCHRCGKPIRRMVIAGRSSHFCLHCQPRPRVTARMRGPRPAAAAKR